MSRKSFQCIVLLSILGTACCGFPLNGNAGWISSNGDFAAAWTDGWTGFSLTADAQSPFTNSYANNGQGIHAETTGVNHSLIQSFTGAPTTGLLYLNADFRNTGTGSGSYSLASAYQAGVKIASMLRINDNGVYADSPTGSGDSLLTPTQGTWYNVQLTLDLDSQTYSGTITPYGGTGIAISSRSFKYGYAGTTSDIDGLFSDSYGNIANAPAHDIDNFGLSTTMATPEPGTLAMLVAAMVGLLARAWRKRT